jgi:tetratricopeptide (TPR) repeat protein
MSDSGFKKNEIRVFVSSTFRDMQKEREELIKFVFPELRKLCDKRGVTWGEVDLRWGITEEETKRGQVLPNCLAEVELCPFFIGILGERYGWVPDRIPQELIGQESWLEDYPGCSVTELEIAHGVLENTEKADHAFFYFRDPSYIDSLPEEEKRNFSEIPTQEELDKFGREKARELAEDRKQKLIDLKKKIKKKLPSNRVRENYRNPRELGELVRKDMTELIEKLYQEREKPDPLKQEAADHEFFAESRRKLYIERKEYYRRLDQHVRGNDAPLVILGESGSGKSALLANWVLKYQEKHPEDLLIMHFIGSSPNSADWQSMLRRIMSEFKQRFEIQQNIPDNPDSLRVAFANWLYMAAAKGRVVLIIDALDQLEDREGALDLVWLSPAIPSNIRLILSTLPGRPLKDVERRKWPKLEVKKLQQKERKRLITKYLKQYGKELESDHVKRIAEKPQTGNPLFLRSLLEELRVFGIQKKLDQRIEHYLSAPTEDCLYEKILERYEQDYDRDRPGLLKESMSFLYSARRGLSESELLDLLGSDQKPLPSARWSPLFLAIEQSLVSRWGIMNFFHEYLRQAVLKRYLPTEDEQKKVRLRLAEYFLNREQSRRRVDELPWLLAKGGDWKRLFQLLKDLFFFEDVWQANEFDVKEYWAQIEKSSDLRMVDAYRLIMNAPEQVSDPDSIVDLARLLRDTGHLKEALDLRKYLVDYYRGTGEESKLASSLGNQAVILNLLGKPDKAMVIYKEEERFCRKLKDKEGLHRSLGNRALILRAQGKLDMALALHREEEEICRELNDKNGLAICLGNQGVVLYLKGNLKKADEKFKEQENLSRELGNKDAQISVHAYKAMIHQDQKKWDKAIKELKDQEDISRELGNKESLQEALGNQGIILYNRGELDEAMVCLKKQEKVCRETGIKDGLQLSLYYQAGIHLNRSERKKALLLLKEQADVLRELGEQKELAQSLTVQLSILAQLNQRQSVLSLAKEANNLAVETGQTSLVREVKRILKIFNDIRRN